MIRSAFALGLLLALAACGSGNDDATAGGVTTSEARALDEAAARTDINATFAEPESNAQ